MSLMLPFAAKLPSSVAEEMLCPADDKPFWLIAEKLFNKQCRNTTQYTFSQLCKNKRTAAKHLQKYNAAYM